MGFLFCYVTILNFLSHFQENKPADIWANHWYKASYLLMYLLNVIPSFRLTSSISYATFNGLHWQVMMWQTKSRSTKTPISFLFELYMRLLFTICFTSWKNLFHFLWKLLFFIGAHGFVLLVWIHIITNYQRKIRLIT